MTKLRDSISSLIRTSHRFSGPVPLQEIGIAEWELVFAFPPSYRMFLHHWGSGRGDILRILGLHAVDLQDDIVMANLRFSTTTDVRHLKFAVAGAGMSFSFDRFEITSQGEYPIVVSEGFEARRRFADSFLEFLRKVSTGGIQSAAIGVLPVRPCAEAALRLSNATKPQLDADEQKLAV
jgi:hypothetical protein